MANAKSKPVSASLAWAFYVLGFFFLASGLGKAVAVYTFVPLVKGILGESYWSAGVALVVPVAEVALGLCLLLRVYPRVCAWVSLVLLALFTIAFAFNFLVHGVEDCGCFGALEILQTPPLVSFIRNGVLMVLAVICVRHSPTSDMRVWKGAVVFVITVASALAAGVSAPRSLWAPQSPWAGKPLDQTPLSAFVRPHPDSSYLVFLFSYQCQHCWDATENVKAFKRTGVVDGIIGLGIGTEQERAAYQQAFEPNFRPAVVSWEKIRPLLGGRGGVPQVYVIEQGKVTAWLYGEVPSPQSFLQHREGPR